MKLIVGLGNPGKEYENTRHNMGFMVIDEFASMIDVDFNKEDFKGTYAKFKLDDEDIILFKPMTYMNLSGEALSLVMNYYKIKPEDVLIVYDDLAIDLGTLRFKGNGSDGGHNGIKSIIQHLGTNKFARLKVGIGPQPPIPSENFVLGNF